MHHPQTLYPSDAPGAIKVSQSGIIAAGLFIIQHAAQIGRASNRQAAALAVALSVIVLGNASQDCLWC